nr:hypothetical protein [Fischerella thermalis]
MAAQFGQLGLSVGYDVAAAGALPTISSACRTGWHLAGGATVDALERASGAGDSAEAVACVPDPNGGANLVDRE